MTGATIGGIAGAAWAAWGASGLATGGTAVAVAGIVVAAAIVALAMTFRTRLPQGDGSSMFSRRGYWIVVVLEVVAIVGGNRLLILLGRSDFVIAWTALVVGVHFVAFGRMFFPGFAVLGWAMIGAAVLGAVVGLLGGPIVPVAGLLSAVALLAGAAWPLVVAARSDPDVPG